jgi:sec-independent protein translocase protein TatA
MVGLDNPIHLVFLLVILLLVFGAKRLPEMGRSLGSGLRGFKESISGEGPAAHAEMTAAPAEPALAPSPERIDALPVERMETRPAA